MCSKKDYIAIAAAIRANRNVPGDDRTVTRLGDMDELAKDLCEYFERDNPRFDIVRFMKAARL